MATPALTVAEFIELPVVKAALPELVAGSQGLEAEVRWVHSLDVPDVANLLRGGEMILTTGVSIGSDAGAQRGFVRDLVAEGAVGVAVELGFAWHREAALRTGRRGRRRGLPMIALKRGVRFVEVSQTVNGNLLNSGYALARRGEELHRNLDRLVLEGAGAEAVLAEVSTADLQPGRARGRPWRAGCAAAPPTESEAPVIDTWSGLKWSGRDAAEAEGAVAMPVTVRDRTWGRVIAIQAGTEFDRFTPIAMERAAVAVGLGLMRGGEEDELRARSRGNLMFELAGGLIDPLTATRRASTLGFPRRHGELVPVAAVWRAGAPGDGASVRAGLGPADRPDPRGALGARPPGSGRLSRQLHARRARPRIERLRAR